MSVLRCGVLAALLLLNGCGGGSLDLSGKPDDGGGSNPPEVPADSLVLARSNSPYADKLIPCVLGLQANNACSLNELNFIYQANPNPTVEDIMNRVVVSDQWMAKRFEDMLKQSNMPNTMLPLFQSVRAVVISKDIRPAFFSPYSGAIYIDPDFIWLTNSEKATINKDEDQRAEYARQFQFEATQRFVKDNARAFPPGTLNDQTERSLAATVPVLASLLFHELAHARDAYHHTFLDTLTPSDTRLSDIYNSRTIPVMNEQVFTSTFALTNKNMKSLSQALYGGETPTAEQKAYTAADVGAMLEGEGANDQYAYYTGYEDFAMLFEETMMKYHYNIDRDVVYLEVPETYTKCDDYIVGWGQRNRLAASEVRPRAQAVARKALANISGTELLEIDSFFSTLGSPTTLPLIGYCSSINPNSRSISDSQFDPRLDRIRY
ncbi:hypothetical protein [Motilimonas sp. KMU-193]|uniref:hypothetical protein n=1 Tax=Motilimonas sp. KMU-193 TaxID=3388668 RepID=UPI00396AFB46